MDKKFVESITISDYEILTDDGFKDVVALHKTIPYKLYKLILENKELKCADNHIVFKNDEEVFVKDLNIGDLIETKDGKEKVIAIVDSDYEKEMWDFELSDNNVKYYTNGILSHNTTYIRKLIQELSEKKTIIYVPTYMMQSIADPELVSFISGFRDTILLLEDSENVLSKSVDDRTQAIANILNMTDGLLNDHMEIQIISTFNTDVKLIDPALKRAGRLMVNYKFGKLTKEQANKIAKKHNMNKKFEKAMTLAEIFEGSNQILSDDVVEEKKIGFHK